MENSELITGVPKGQKSVANASALAGHRPRNTLRQISLVMADVTSLVAIVLLSNFFIDRLGFLDIDAALESTRTVVSSIAFVVVATVLLTLLRISDPEGDSHLATRLLRVAGVVSFASMLSALPGVFISSATYDPAFTLLLWTFAIVTLPIAEAVGSRIANVIGLGPTENTPVIMVGTADSTTAAKEHFQQEGSGLEVVGWVNLNGVNVNGNSVVDDIPQLGNLDSLQGIMYRRENQDCLVVVSADRYGELATRCDFPSTGDAASRIILLSSSDQAELLSSVGLGKWKQTRRSWMYQKAKRGIDLVIAITAIVLASPLIGIISLLIKLDSPGPVIFRQARVGRRGRIFNMHKFRSMYVNAEEMQDKLASENEASGPMFKISDDPRITRIGRIIRRLSLDELPQLFDVVTGTMSIVGPRPPLPHEVGQYEPRQFRRLDAVPGITGLWQVNRGFEISFDEMVTIDLEYLERWSLGLELGIILKTIPSMLRGKGAY